MATEFIQNRVEAPETLDDLQRVSARLFGIVDAPQRQFAVGHGVAKSRLLRQWHVGFAGDAELLQLAFESVTVPSAGGCEHRLVRLEGDGRIDARCQRGRGTP